MAGLGSPNAMSKSVTCGLLCEADEHPRKLARLSPGVSDGDDATIRSLLVEQLEHRHVRGQRPGDQLGDQCDADARRDAGELPDPVGDHDLRRRAEVISGRKGTDGDVAKGTVPDSVELAAQLIV